MIQPIVVLGLTLNILQFNPGAGLAVLNPDFNPKVLQDMIWGWTGGWAGHQRRMDMNLGSYNPPS